VNRCWALITAGAGALVPNRQPEHQASLGAVTPGLKPRQTTVHFKGIPRVPGVKRKVRSGLTRSSAQWTL